MKVLAYAILAAQVFVVSPVLACEGQVGATIYEDTFEDDSGGWDLTPPNVIVQPPVLQISLAEGAKPGTGNAYSAQVLTFRANEADYCVVGTLPKSPTPDNKYTMGLEFWAVDYQNLWLAQLDSNGTFSLWSRSNGQWSEVNEIANAPSFKADGPNALRVTTIGGKISVSLNGRPLKAVRAALPDKDLRFGVYGAITKVVDGMTPIKVSSFKVTTGK